MESYKWHFLLEICKCAVLISCTLMKDLFPDILTGLPFCLFQQSITWHILCLTCYVQMFLYFLQYFFCLAFGYPPVAGCVVQQSLRQLLQVELDHPEALHILRNATNLHGFSSVAHPFWTASMKSFQSFTIVELLDYISNFSETTFQGLWQCSLVYSTPSIRRLAQVFC